MIENFHIKHGEKINIPSTKTNGTFYVTTDTNDFYVDLIDNRINLNPKPFYIQYIIDGTITTSLDTCMYTINLINTETVSKDKAVIANQKKTKTAFQSLLRNCSVALSLDYTILDNFTQFQNLDLGITNDNFLDKREEIINRAIFSQFRCSIDVENCAIIIKGKAINGLVKIPILLEFTPKQPEITSPQTLDSVFSRNNII